LHRAVWIGIALLLTACPDPEWKALAAREKNDPEGAAARWVEIAKADRANLAAWDAAVRLWCRELARVDRCVEVLELELDLLGSLQRHQEELSVALEARARDRLKIGLVKSALMDLERARLAGPKRASVLTANAKAYALIGERSLALEQLAKARLLEPDHPEIEEVVRALPDEEGFGGATP